MSAASRDAYDLAVLGGGPAGYTAAIRAAQLGLRAVVVDAADRLGGVCLHWGCIPTKALLRQAQVLKLARHAADFGLQLDGEINGDWDAVIARSRRIAGELADGIDQLLAARRIDVVHGRGRLTPTRAVEVRGADGDTQTLRARHVLLATGGRARSLPGVDIDGERVISSRQALVLERCPQSLAIVGAGAIGVELATFFRGFGAEVTLLEAEAQVLPREDPDAGAVVAAALAADGVAVHTGVQVTAIEGGARRKTTDVAFAGPAGSWRVRAERVLMAVGVIGNTEDLGLEALGVQVDAGRVVVDEHCATTVRGVYAVGDLTGAPQLAHAAVAEARVAVDGIAGRPSPARSAIPSCTYGEPEVASVGLTEAQARAQGLEVRVGRFPWAASGRARAGGDTTGFVKLVFGARYGDLLGGVIVGPEATELIGEVGLALALEATWEELAHTVHAHPTLSEGIMEAAAAAFGEAIHI